MKKLALILLFACSSVFAQPNELWVHSGDSKNFSFYFKKGSLEFTNDGAQLIQAVHKKEGGKVNFYMISMKFTDCKNGYGFVYQYTLDGKLFDRLDYVEYGGTVAQNFGDILCYAIKNQKSV